MVLAFSLTGGTIPAGNGLLVNVEVDGSGACLSDVVISDASGNQLDVSIDECLTMIIGSPTIYGCTDSDACNYDSDATDEDGSCEYPQEYYDCFSVCLFDEDGDGYGDTRRARCVAR